MELKIASVGRPVVYTNNAGGGDDEVQAPENNDNTMRIYVGEVEVVAAWYNPIDNLSSFPRIHRILCIPDGENVQLRVKGLPGNKDARVRIEVFAAYYERPACKD